MVREAGTNHGDEGQLVIHRNALTNGQTKPSRLVILHREAAFLEEWHQVPGGSG